MTSTTASQPPVQDERWRGAVNQGTEEQAKQEDQDQVCTWAVGHDSAGASSLPETKRKAVERMRRVKWDPELVATPKPILLKLQLPAQMPRDPQTRDDEE